MISIRGANTVKDNTRQAIFDGSSVLISAVIAANKLNVSDISDIIFTATDDLNASYPAEAARALGITNAGLICAAEMPVEGSLRKCVRLLMRAEKPGAVQSGARHVFLNGAAKLRPDLTSFSVAIDGPNNSGKSTTARLLAKRLNTNYLDSGSLYRTIALYNLRKGNDLRYGQAVLDSLPEIDVEVEFGRDGSRSIILNGENVTDELFTSRISDGASLVGIYPGVREKLLKIQRYIALTRNIVMDGRDVGSHVLPWANVKVYLDARLDVQVEREIKKRREQNKGLSLDPEEVRREVAERDERDKNRKISPLIQVEDAVYVDTSDMTPDEVAEEILRRCGDCFTDLQGD